VSGPSSSVSFLVIYDSVETVLDTKLRVPNPSFRFETRNRFEVFGFSKSEIRNSQSEIILFLLPSSRHSSGYPSDPSAEEEERSGFRSGILIAFNGFSTLPSVRIVYK